MLANAISVLAAFFGCLSMSLYFSQVLRGISIPNPATWVVWLVIGSINTITYFTVVQGNLVRSINLVVVTAGIFAVTIYSFVRGKFSPLRSVDKICLALGLAIGILWQVTGNAVLANLILQLVYIISFVPTVLGLRRGDLAEGPWPWIFALCAYVLMIVSILMSWNPDSWVALAHPLLNGLVGNGLVVYYATRRPFKRPQLA